MKREWTIRALEPGDMPEAKAVLDSTGLFPSAMLEEMTASYFRAGGADSFWLTLNDGKPVAVVYCAAEPMTQGTWNLLLVAVRAERQGLGYGTAMLRHVEGMLAARSARVLLVETSGLESFERTRAFYRKAGYEEEARIREFYRAGEDKVVFYKRLGAAA